MAASSVKSSPKPAPKPKAKPAPKAKAPAPKAKPAPKAAADPTGAKAKAAETKPMDFAGAAKKKAEAAETSSTKEKDKVELSKEAGDADKAEKAEEPKVSNPYDGVADKTEEVTVDPYKKGKNDTVEGMLRNQGYSLQDIYNKDKNGKTLIDHVARVNELKNPNVIQDGAKLKIPSRADSESLSNQDLKPGEQQKTEVNNKKVGVETDTKMEKKKDGTTEVNVETSNRENPDAALSTKTTVPKDGRVDTSTTATKKGNETNTVAQNKDGSAVTQEKIVAEKDKTTATIKDIDKTGNNSTLTATPEKVTVVNPGSDKAGDIKSEVDISEKSSDGFFENRGRDVAEFFGFQGEAPEAVTKKNVGQVDVVKDKEGVATVTTGTGKNKEEILKTKGDTDDTWIERAGEGIDEGIDYVGNKISDAGDAISDTAASVGNWISNWWNGTDNKVPNNDVETSKSGVYKKTQRGLRRVR